MNCLSKNKLSYPTCHGILVGTFFLVHLISGGLFFSVGVDSEEYKVADSADKIVGCRWKSFGTGPSAAISVIAILVSIAPAIISTLLIKNSSDECKPAFKVNRFALLETTMPISEENIEEVCRVSSLVKKSYIYTGLILVIFSILSTCAVPSTIISIVGWVGIFLYAVYWRGGVSLKLPTTTSNLNDVLSPPGGPFFYAGLLFASVGLAVDDNSSPTGISGIFIFILGMLTIDLSMDA